MLPALMDLHRDSEAFGWKLQEIKYLLEQLVEQTKPRPEPVYSNARSNGLAASLVVKSGAGRLFGFSGINTNASAQFILGFDLARNSPPANGTVPDFATKAPASDVFWMSWAPNWRQMTRGIILCNSSTAASLTIGAADCFFDAQYL